MFSRKNINYYVEAANLPGYTDKNLLYASYSKKERQYILRNSDSLEDKQIVAALEVQRMWKGYRLRSMIHSILHSSNNNMPTTYPSLYSQYKSHSFFSTPSVTELCDSMNKSRLSFRLQSSMSKRKSRLEISYESYYEEAIQKNKMNKEKLLTFQEFCAVTIQSWWKDKVKPKILSAKSEKFAQEPSVIVKKIVHMSADKAATLVQRAWRKHVDVQVFNYYKNLISFQSQGDPYYMLKCINPKEAELMDTSGYLHLRFRLGGSNFPPTIYYKIYSNINVADIGSFAPRNYTHASTKLLPGKFIHNNNLQISQSTEDLDDEWYQRYENNGWRQVSDKILRQMREDWVEVSTSQKKINYNFDKLVRQQDVAARKKRKKLNWMKKMYSMGVLKVRENEEKDVEKLVHTAAESLFASVGESNDNDDVIDQINDWEVDELLQWTQGLNFDRYAEEWSQTGTALLKRIHSNQGLAVDS